MSCSFFHSTSVCFFCSSQHSICLPQPAVALVNLLLVFSTYCCSSQCHNGWLNLLLLQSTFYWFSQPTSAPVNLLLVVTTCCCFSQSLTGCRNLLLLQSISYCRCLYLLTLYMWTYLVLNLMMFVSTWLVHLKSTKPPGGILDLLLLLLLVDSTWCCSSLLVVSLFSTSIFSQPPIVLLNCSTLFKLLLSPTQFLATLFPTLHPLCFCCCLYLKKLLNLPFHTT